VSGVAKGIQMEEVLVAAGLTPDELDCCVTLGYMAEDTGSNAIESAVWVHTNKIASIRLVTSSYHMPRSLLEFHATIPGMEVIPHPVFPEHVMVEEWWARPGTASLVVAEYNKYLLAATRHWLRGIEGK
ncbi:MAG: YdcF family protein, partial [Alphaproteobacteria bacterium]|nr:YdcF family protein [Alphaproteobacteria bacterium]